MTPGRAALVGLMERYLGGLLDPFVSLLEVHKLMYFMQDAGGAGDSASHSSPSFTIHGTGRLHPCSLWAYRWQERESRDELATTNSALPPQAAFHHAVLRHLARHPEGDRRRNIHEVIPDLMGLSEVQRTERLANLPHLRYRHRSGWALSMLKAAGYADSPAPGVWRITERGRDLLGRYPDGFDEETGRRVIREGRREIQGEDVAGGEAADVGEPAAQQTPDERIDIALEELRHTAARELLEKIAHAPPVFFEELVLDLLHALACLARSTSVRESAPVVSSG